MRNQLMSVAVFALAALAADKSLPNQAGNAKLSLNGTAVTDRKAVTDLMGIDLGEGFIVVKIKAAPQTLAPLRISIDDFTLVSRKNGEKSGAMSPSAIAGSGGIIITGTQSGQGIGATNGMGMPIGIPTRGSGGGIGNAGTTEGGMAEVRTERRSTSDPRLPFLEAKVLQDRETLEPIEGLLYFNLAGKLKPENLGMIYAGPAGRLVIDFK
jgi:hypothetical protein